MPTIEHHLAHYVGPAPSAWLFPGSGHDPIRPMYLDRAWKAAREAAGRPDLHLHDLRHTGLTWAASTGASTAELMRRGGHGSPQAALRYQRATEERDRALAASLAALAASTSAEADRFLRARGAHAAPVTDPPPARESPDHAP